MFVPVRMSVPAPALYMPALPPLPITPESVAPAEFVTLMVPVLLSMTPLLDENAEVPAIWSVPPPKTMLEPVPKLESARNGEHTRVDVGGA